VILFLMSQTGHFNNVIPLISLYVYAGYRLMPAFQQIYNSFTLLAAVGPSLDKLHNDIKNLKPFNLNQNQDILSLNTAITLKNIYYNYSNTSRFVLKNISLTIPAKSKVGIIGTTGCGKTTIVDIILGLLEAQKGILKVDNEVITQKNSRAWRKCVGYVPQHIYLSDDTIAANIAFGIEPKYINKKQVIKTSKIANLHDFVINDLPKKYQTIIGERGVRLSGGQRQRIGIARALYHNPKVLVLDEATSALDNRTEKYVMDALNNLDKDLTIILIAHRINTLRFCDIIFKINKGKLVGEEVFNQLIKKLT
jgi:ATP-binding cassette, subfamily B, bacterial PglK